MDLYHRLNVINIHVPNLTERTEDIPEIAQSFLDDICRGYGMPVKTISMDAMLALQALPWTGNVRELHNMIERLIILSDKVITGDDVVAFANPGGGTNIGSATSNVQVSRKGTLTNFDQFNNFQEYKDHAEKEYIKFKLEKNNWNVSKTADDIDIQRSHLYSKIEKFGLKRVTE
jgi:two-component system nitrogen regulation response regulator NtrX